MSDNSLGMIGIPRACTAQVSPADYNGCIVAGNAIQQPFTLIRNIDMALDENELPFGTKVICIDASDKQKLTRGNIYEIEEDYPKDNRCVLAGLDGKWRRDRFDLVQEKENKPSLPKISSSSHEDDQKVLDFFKAVPEGYCPCNIPRSICHFHNSP
jgi:hypothetical protein